MGAIARYAKCGALSMDAAIGGTHLHSLFLSKRECGIVKITIGDYISLPLPLILSQL